MKRINRRGALGLIGTVVAGSAMPQTATSQIRGYTQDSFWIILNQTVSLKLASGRMFPALRPGDRLIISYNKPEEDDLCWYIDDYGFERVEYYAERHHGKKDLDYKKVVGYGMSLE